MNRDVEYVSCALGAGRIVTSVLASLPSESLHRTFDNGKYVWGYLYCWKEQPMSPRQYLSWCTNGSLAPSTFNCIGWKVRPGPV